MKHNFEAAYKRKKSGKLKWISCYAEDSKQADNIMDSYVGVTYPLKQYLRYAGALPIKQKSN